MSQARILVMVAWVMAALPVGLAGCGMDEPCDDDQELRDGYCFAVVPVVFGQVCASGSECGRPADFCAIEPGKPTGVCTAFGCDTDPTICPADWTCMDLGPFGLQAHMCAPPTP